VDKAKKPWTALIFIWGGGGERGGVGVAKNGKEGSGFDWVLLLS
jgi:hypothetical protein